jgi:hypothetical protein
MHLEGCGAGEGTEGGGAVMVKLASRITNS